MAFDGTTCSYDGPTTSPPGLLVIEAEAGPVPYAILVAHLVEGATLEEALAYAAEHPEEQPPMVDDASFVGEPGASDLEPARLLPGTNAVVCVTMDDTAYPAASIEVAG